MKKKLLVLSASAILASNFIFDNNASAVVDIRKNTYESESLNYTGNRSTSEYLKLYKDSLEKLIKRLSLNMKEGYYEKEYKDVYGKYQLKFMAEMDALNKFIQEERDMSNYEHDWQIPNGLYGLTHQRYLKIYESLEKNREEFEKGAIKVESQYEDLKYFDEKRLDEVAWTLNQLENKIIMIGNTFQKNKPMVVQEMYNKLDVVVGVCKRDRYYNFPINERMYKQMKDDLETIIDQFFEEAELARPLNIQPQSEINKDDESIKQKLRDDALAAKYDNSLVDPEVQKRSEKAKAHIAEITKKSREAKAKVEAEKNTKINKSYFKNPKDFKHKIYKPTREAQNGSLNELSIKFPESSQQLPIYTVTSESKTQPVLKQQTKEEKVDVLKSKRPGTTLNGLNGESNLVTIDESANASTQFGSNGHVFEYSFDSTPKTTNVAKQNIKQENYNSVNNLAGMSGESQHVDFTQDSNPTTTYGGYGNAFDLTEDTAPKQPETITESHEIVFNEYTDITMSGFTKGESIEDTNLPTQTNQKN